MQPQPQPSFRPIVLVVEDEPLQRIMAVDLIEDAGFVAVEAWDAAEAVRILEKRTDIRLVFADLDVPNSTDALKLAALIRDRWPTIHIIITSGRYGPRDVTLPADTAFFTKPYPHDAVVREMRRMTAAALQTEQRTPAFEIGRRVDADGQCFRRHYRPVHD